MLSQFSYPVISTKNYVETVDFYEDFFEFVPVYELPDFVILQRYGWENTYLAIIKADHKILPESYRKPTNGLILNYPVKDADAFYQQTYWEGLNIVSEPEVTPCARKHFFVEDPNGILIDVVEDITDEKQDPHTESSLKELCDLSA